MKLGKLNNYKKILTTFVLIIGLVFSFSFNALGGVLYASNAFVNPLSNPTFTQSYNTDYIASLNGWSVISYDGYNDLRLKDKYQAGSVKASSVSNSKKVSYQKLWDDFSLIEDPGKANEHSNDSKYDTYLMLNSSRTPGRIGYQTSSDFTLEANSFYSITVTFKTFNDISSSTVEGEMIQDQGEDGEKVDTVIQNNSFASIYIKGLSDDSFASQAKFERVSTQNTWSKRTFWISTTSFASEKLRLELWLGGSKITDRAQGAVFFNEVDIQRFNPNFYYEESSKRALDDTHNIINLDTNPYITHQVTNASFENGLQGWNQLPNQVATANDKLEVVNLGLALTYKDITTPRSNNTAYDNRNALFIYLEEDGFLGVTSHPINITAGAYYRLSVWAISNCNIGEGATIRVIEHDASGKRLLEEATALTPPTTIANKYNNRNGWVQYNFYIQGNGLEDKQVYLELSLGNEEVNTKGYVFFDDITLQQISHSNYLRANVDASTEVINLEKSSEKLFMIANQSFNHISHTGIEQVIYPALPNAWTFNDQSKYANSGYVNGVINTDANHFNANKHFYPFDMPNPGAVKYSTLNNVLVLGSRVTSDALSYTSEEFNFEKNSTYYLSFYFYSHILDNSNIDAKMSMKVFNDSFVVCEHNFTSTNNSWKQLTFEINTGLTAGTFKLQLSFENIKGYVYFDEFMLTNTPHLTEKYAVKTIVNLDNNDFSSFNNWQTTSTGEDNYSNITKNNLSFLEYCGINQNDVLHYNDGNLSALYILNQTKSVTSTSSTNTFALVGGEYYKISIWIRTDLIESEEDNENIGALFAVKYGDTVDELTGIITYDYTNYAFYINPETDINVQITFGLGYEDANTSGIAYFDNLQITTFSSLEDFEDDQTNETTDNIKVIVASNDAEEEDHDHEDDHDHDHDHDHSANIWMAISGLITGVAILIAMIGTAIRKIKWRRPAKVSTTYDRRKTLNKSLDRQELIELHNSLIKEIEAELKAEKQNYEQQSEIINNEISLLKDKMKTETAELKTTFKELEKDKDKQERQLNAKLAENKLGTTLKDDRECQKQIASILSAQKKVQKSIDKIENKYESEIYKLETMLASLALKPQMLEQEISDLKNDVEKIKAKDKAEAMKSQKNK